MRGRGPLFCVSLALALQACGGGNGGVAPPDGPAGSAAPPAGSAPAQTPTDPGPSEAAPPESAPARATLSCADIFPAELPPAVEFTAEVLAHHSRCGPGLTDGQANYVALTAFGDVIGSRLYRFVPIEGGEASPNLVGGLYPEVTVFGLLIPQAHGYLWKWDGSGMSAPHLGPIPMYDEQGALLGVAQTLGKADTIAALPAGGSVATTVEYTNQPDATRQMLWRVERLDEAGRRLATYDDGWEPYDRYPPIGLVVNLAGHVLVSRYPHLRWLDGDLTPLTDWFPASDYGIRTPLADGSVAFRRFGQEPRRRGVEAPGPSCPTARRPSPRRPPGSRDAMTTTRSRSSATGRPTRWC